MRNDGLEKALQGTWKNKDKFYEDTKGLSITEIVKEIENKYKAQDILHNRYIYTTQPDQTEKIR